MQNQSYILGDKTGGNKESVSLPNVGSIKPIEADNCYFIFIFIRKLYWYEKEKYGNSTQYTGSVLVVQQN